MQQRINTLREGMEAVGCDGYFSLARAENEYLSGFRGTTAAVIITPSEAHFLCDFRYTEQAGRQVQDLEVHEVEGALETRLGEWMDRLGISSAGFDSTALSFHQHQTIENGFAGALIPLPDLVRGMRMVKSPEEIERLKAASALAESVLRDLIPELSLGMREEELAARFAFELRKRGAQGESFDMIALFGARSSLPHGMPGPKALEKGDIVLLDFGCVLNSYCSDLTRTFACGTLPGAWFQEIYEVTLHAQLAALDAIRPGVCCRDVDAIARNIISDAGYGDYFGHGLGHGVGLEIHEAPRLNKLSNTILEAGMIVTVEPGIYLPQKGGVRIEDLVAVTEDGYELLTTTPKDLRILDV